MKAAEVTDFSKDGFLGYYYAAESNQCCMIVVIGNRGNGMMNTACAKWLLDGPKCNALCIGVCQHPDDDGGVHRWPLEIIEAAAAWLKKKSMEKIGILGMSVQAALALCAAAEVPSISLTVGLSPNDFVPWGFCHGRIGKNFHAEWPSETSAFSYHGEDLPFQPAEMDREEYWQLFLSAQKKYKEMHSISVFETSEARHPVEENCRIRAEKIRGKIILVGAEDDAMWNAKKYIERLENRLKEKHFGGCVQTYLYPFGTHLLVPQSMVKNALSVFGNLVPCLFASGRAHLKECRRARLDLDEKLTADIENWKND